jgi:Sigma-70 region 2
MRMAGPDAPRVANDATVIERSWRDPEQFATLFDRYAPLIHRYINRRVGRQAADDLVAETFLAAFRKRRGYDLSYADARPWLYGMATNLLLPDQEAALFELMAQTPGFAVVPGARDAIGRTGVAVRWTYLGASAEIILNPVSYAYLGDRTWPEPGFHGKGANAYDGGALVRMAFVDRAGELR